MRKDFDPESVALDGRQASKSRLFEPNLEPWRGSLDGTEIGGDVTILAYGTDEIGGGPRLHVHPYDETFVIVLGRARFTVGSAGFEASAGEVVLGPKGVPHKFENLGPGRLQTIDIHHSPEWIQTDLEH